MSSRSISGIELLETPEPGAGGGVVERTIEPGPNALVVLDVQCGEALIAGVPARRGQLMHQVEALENLLVQRAVEHQPVRLRIIDAVAECDVESPGDLVDEIVHVIFEAAIVVAGEDDAPLVVKKDPATEMD